jgi:transcriptional regulator with XRE-family HTH domain
MKKPKSNQDTDLRKKVNAICKSLRWNQNALAGELKVSPSLLSKALRTNKPSADLLSLIEDFHRDVCL